MPASPADTLPTPSAVATPTDIIYPPGDLYSDEPPLETDLHRDQIDLLLRLLKELWRDRNNFYASGNLTVYYSRGEQPNALCHMLVALGPISLALF